MKVPKQKKTHPKVCLFLEVLNEMYIGLEVNCLLSTIICNLAGFFLANQHTAIIECVPEYIAFSTNGERTGKG